MVLLSALLIISVAFLAKGLINDSANMIDIAEFTLCGPLLGFMGNWSRRESEQAQYRLAHLQLNRDITPEPIIMLEEKGVIRSFSGAAAQLFDWPPHELVATNVSSFVPEPYCAEHGHYRTSSDKKASGTSSASAASLCGSTISARRLREFGAKSETEHAVETPLTLIEEAVAPAAVGPKEQAVSVAIRNAICHR
ncbi:PAS domain-containing protein [Bradyrhizobium sp. NBAIM01]|uniref:PAS domain-containing protein n=1 Tax=Bradyrhizobium sp. NBAIM01 TaxID=2793818 RepID=UPI001CD7A65D|nr:PAS domain-containing protein [Bradyrhizobium sp. NBAIM01]